MKFIYLCLAALSAVAVSDAAFQDEATCVKATSDDAPVWGLVDMAGSIPSLSDIDTAGIKDAVKSALTTIGSDDLDQCIGSLQPSKVVAIAVPLISSDAFKKHLPNIMEYAENSESFKETTEFVQKIMATLQGSSDISAATLVPLITSASAFFKSIEPKDVEEFCSLHENDIAPVFVSTIAPTLLSLFEKASSGCCDPLLAKIKTSLGAEDLEAFLYDALKVFSNVLCGKISKDEETLRCGHRVVNSLLVNMLGDIPPFVTLPNSESCKAFTGKEFTTVNEKDHTYPANDEFSKGKDLDGCGKNFVDLTSMVSSVPAIASLEVGGEKISNLFGDGTTVDIAALLTGSLGEDVAAMAAQFLGAKLHIATSVGECEFSYESADTVFPAKNAPSPDTPDTPDSPDTPDTPDSPDTPDTPDSPDTPNSPDTPDAKTKVPDAVTPKPTEGSNAPVQSFSALVSAVIMLFALMQLM